MEKFESVEIIIGEDSAGERIDKVLSLHPLISSRTQAGYLIDQNLVTKNNKSIKASHKTAIGESFQVKIPVIQKSGITPYEIDLEIVYEDKDLLVVNKPSGIVVHPSKGHLDKTLVNALVHHTKDLSMGFGEDRPGIIHRIDKETSGLLVVAKNNNAQEILSEQFKARQIHRIYWAVVIGDYKVDSGKIETLIGRHPSARKKFSSLVDQGKTAITNFKVLKRKKKLTLIEVKLETGRTHQIRVHFSDKGYPVFGDALYGARNRSHVMEAKELKDLNMKIPRIALHAKELGFIHPTTQEKMHFNSELPEDLRVLFEKANLL